MRRVVTIFFCVCALAPGIATAKPEIGTPLVITRNAEAGDAVVVAVIDTAITPYHWDYLASKMPQHLDDDPKNDLPLNRPPDEWLRGFPSPKKSFKTYAALDLTLEEKDGDASPAMLDAQDAAEWEKVKGSTRDEINYYWMPGTKVIGAIDFGTNRLHADTGAHGVGTTSSAVGNLHGTCPECLLVFVANGGDGEGAIEWAMKQPWIDVISNSYGYSATSETRDRIYSGSNTEAQRKASERGQTILFSAGNGQENGFVVPNTTSFSSQEGPDWIVTVGAISPGEDNYYYEQGYRGQEAYETAYHASYLGHGKPADISGIGRNYPTAHEATTISGTGASGFSGTSNSTPQIAGTYARALYVARKAMAGASRIQSDGLVAFGDYNCGRKRPACELRDGALTAEELRTRLFHGAVHTEAGLSGPAGVGQLPAVGEEEFLNEGHGSYFGRETGRIKDYLKELDRVLLPLFGRAKPMERPAGEYEWMIVDSFCRQHIWGPWKGGYYREGKMELPGIDPMWPLRSAIEKTCPFLQPPP
ncbi:MAG: S8 family peptidase [Actinomycetota bacterium]|nr:S8 family peptidase [Actinomycetota bacterium]